MALIAPPQNDAIHLHTRCHDYVYTRRGECTLDGHLYHVYTSTNFLSHDVNRRTLRQAMGHDVAVFALIQPTTPYAGSVLTPL